MDKPDASDWHALAVADALARQGGAQASGLSTAEAARRLATHGANRLAETPPRPVWRKFLDQFRSLLVLILLAAAVLAALVGELKDALVIFVVVLLNATLGFVQEHRAENALAALRQMLAPSARVRRDGVLQQVAASDLVPGDILLLEAGDRISADARVLLASSAEVAEAALTGESQAVSKATNPVHRKSALAERRSMVFMNTVVTRGRLEVLVVATGMATEMGRLAGLLAQAVEKSTPLQVQLDALGKRLALIAGVVVGIMFLAGLARGDDLARTAMTAIALAVAAIPEGLPAVVTLTLALGMARMARRNAIVKRLGAVETLGCTTVICSDKTGTLTHNEMTARALVVAGRQLAVSGEGYAATGALSTHDGSPLPALDQTLMPAVLCADARLDSGELVGDPTEGALLALAAKAGMNVDELRTAHPRLAEIPFDSAVKFMATAHAEGDQVRLWFKGAPDVLLARSQRWATNGVSTALDDAARTTLQRSNAELAGKAMRVLALATRTVPAAEFDPSGDLMPWAQDLTLLALVGIIDPPRAEAKLAIATCKEAGIAVKMITGDHPLTAAAIARELGLVGEAHEGRELDGLDDAALAAMIERSAVFARVAPEHKMRIVAALQAQGHVVAMTGDGVNDAPALKTADIGIAMGITGTEVSKEAATLVLADDNFATIVRAVEEGRTIYDNIVKFVRFQLATNIGAILTVLGASLAGLATPFTAIQILWVNLIMDGPPAMTLGVEPPRPGLMQQTPRPASAAILSLARLWRLGLYGLTMAAGTLAVYAHTLSTGNSPTQATTLAFTTFVLFQWFNIFNARSEFESALNRQFFTNGKLWIALAAVAVLQVLAVHWGPAQTIFDTTALTAHQWLLAITVASSTLLLDEARKLGLRLWVLATQRTQTLR